MSVKKTFLSFLVFPLLISSTSEVWVKDYIDAGGSAKVDIDIETKVNGGETKINVNQPGEIEVNVKNGKVEVKTSQGVTPTIIITGIPTQEIKIETIEQTDQVKTEQLTPIVNFLRTFFRKLFGFLRLSAS